MKKKPSGRLSVFHATMVVAQRDFISMVMSKMFLIYLLGPLLSLIVTGIAGAILVQGETRIGEPKLIIQMSEADEDRIKQAQNIVRTNTIFLPDIAYAKSSQGDPLAIISDVELQSAAVLYGTIENPKLLTVRGKENHMTSAANLLVAEARRFNADANAYPSIKPDIVRSPNPGLAKGSFLSSKVVQFILYILTSTMAVMILSNLSEEKSNRIVEILATAIPMESLFAGKLLAMLAGTFIALATWTGFASIIWMAVAENVQHSGLSIEPLIGWASFVALFFTYFALSYLFVGAIYLIIGGVAATPRDAQIFAMPATIVQILAFLMGSWASSADGIVPWVFSTVPIVSPYVLLGKAAESGDVAIHVYGIIIQIIFVAVTIKYGSRLFRKRIVDPGKKRRFSRKPKLT